MSARRWHDPRTWFTRSLPMPHRMKKPHPQLAQKEQAFYKIFFLIWVLPVRSPDFSHGYWAQISPLQTL